MPWHFRAWQSLTGSRRRPEPWGAGVVDEGFDPLGLRARWDDAAADELVFLLPGLVRTQGSARLASILAEGLARREAGRLRDDPTLAVHATAWLRATRDALETGTIFPGQPGLLEAACLGWETGIHGGYLVPEAELLSEAMAAAAWLGHICRGRDALLPPVLHSALAERLAEAETSDANSPSALVSSYLSYRVRQAGLGDALRKAGRDLDGTQAPALVRAPAGALSPRALPDALKHALERSTARLVPAEPASSAGRCA